jgi:hypothetical protein
MTRPGIATFLDAQSPELDRWRRKNLYYYESIERIPVAGIEEMTDIIYASIEGWNA